MPGRSPHQGVLSEQAALPGAVQDPGACPWSCGLGVLRSERLPDNFVSRMTYLSGRERAGGFGASSGGILPSARHRIYGNDPIGQKQFKAVAP